MPVAAFILLKLIDFYILLVFVWVFSSWFPQWRYSEWMRAIGRMVEPFVNLFRGLGLRSGQFDLSPMAAMLTLQLFRMLVGAVGSGGLVR